MAEGWEKALLTAGSADTAEREGREERGRGADREERTELPRGLEMKEPNPERAIIHS